MHARWRDRSHARDEPCRCADAGRYSSVGPAGGRPPVELALYSGGWMDARSPIVDVGWLLDHLDDQKVVVVDARPVHAFRAAHILGARSFDTNALRLPSSDPAAIA